MDKSCMVGGWSLRIWMEGHGNKKSMLVSIAS